MFPGFTAADFDAYQPKKWKSNVFNRERLEVKQKLVALGRELQGTMLAPDGSPLAVEASVEHPTLWNHKQVEAQHLYFSRNEGARKELDAIIDRGKSIASMIDDPSPQRNHLFLAVTLTRAGARAVAQAASRRARRSREPRAQVRRSLRAREAAAPAARPRRRFASASRPSSSPVAELDEGKLLELIAQLGQGRLAAALTPGAPQRLFYVGRAIARDEALAAGAALRRRGQRLLQSLLPIYRFIAWSRDNDFVSISEALQKEKQQKRQKGLAKNDAVRIIRGMFAGKQGVVQEVDAKGGLRVLVGKVAVKLDADDVQKS